MKLTKKSSWLVYIFLISEILYLFTTVLTSNKKQSLDFYNSIPPILRTIIILVFILVNIIISIGSKYFSVEYNRAFFEIFRGRKIYTMMAVVWIVLAVAVVW